MNEQDKPLALMLAETLEYDNFTGDEIEAAKELRRLHAENEELKKQAKLMEYRLFILEELKNVAKRIDSENDDLRRDAECFRFWVREAEASPSAMAKLIMNCRTEEDYRNIIEPLAMAAQNAIDAAMKDKKC